MINILLCDDDENTLTRIQRYIDSVRSDIRYEIDMKCYLSAEDVLHTLQNSKECGDILIPDIDMPGLSGMELVQMLQDEGIDILLIFITAHAEYVFKSFEYSPFRYIRKEFMETELLPALHSACDKVLANRDVSLSVKTQEGMEVVRSKDILYYELENRKCIIYTIQNKKYETWKKIKELRSEMGRNDGFFLQIYRGCMVNKRYIKSIKNDMIILENGTKIPISRRKKQEITDAMMNYWSGIL